MSQHIAAAGPNVVVAASEPPEPSAARLADANPPLRRRARFVDAATGTSGPPDLHLVNNAPAAVLPDDSRDAITIPPA